MDPATIADLVDALERNTAAQEQGAAVSRALLTALCESDTEAAKRIRVAKVQARELAKARSQEDARLAAELEAKGTTLEADRAKWRERRARLDAKREAKAPKRTLAELTGRGVQA